MNPTDFKSDQAAVKNTIVPSIFYYSAINNSAQIFDYIILTNH